MSMNLFCEEVDLWQTPTYITYMCYSNQDGGWQGIKYRYIQWVKAQVNGSFKSVKEADEVRAVIDKHIKEINRHKKLTFHIV